tara:strand:+ start:1221 stop:1652 length:432 start_codon:yes stop_codon:yes gene_type:complete
VKLLLGLITVFIFASCGGEKNDQLVEVVGQYTSKNKVKIISAVEKIDTINLISKLWNSVYYIKDHDTIYSNKPFEIEFINDSDKLSYLIDNQSDSNQIWNLEGNIFKITGVQKNYYYILEISDSTFRTEDTIQSGFEYFFKTN